MASPAPEAPAPVVIEPAIRPVVSLDEPTPYVGRRVARAAETPVPLETPAPVAPVLSIEAIDAPSPLATPVPAAPATPVTVQVPAAEQIVAAVALLDVPSPRRSPETVDWNLFAADSAEETGQLPFALTEAFTGSMPRIDAEPGTDFSHDTTASLPVVLAGKRRGGRAVKRRSHLRLLPSLPALVGVAALAVAGFGAVTAGESQLVRADAGPLRQAGALTGTSAVASVGAARGVSVSRSSSRTGGDAETTAKAREATLAKLAQQAAGQAAKLKENQWQLPITPGAYHLTARFGQYGLWANAHTGLDFAAPTGTPIHAVSNGVISSAQYDGAYGNKTVETLEDGTELWYCHQVQFNVSPGDEVHAGDVIGYVGATGHVTGPHVHLEVRPGGGDPVDPYPALVEHGLQP